MGKIPPQLGLLESGFEPDELMTEQKSARNIYKNNGMVK